MERGTGVTGRYAVSRVAMETRSEHGLVATLAQPPSPEPATCPPAQVSLRTKTFLTREDALMVMLEMSLSNHLRVHLSSGIEDAFRTAATEVSLLAGTNEFNATELFGVGEPPHTSVNLSFRCSSTIIGSSATWQQCSAVHSAFLTLGLNSFIGAEMKMCSRKQHSGTAPSLSAMF